MKQHITKEQWEEIGADGHNDWTEKMNHCPCCENHIICDECDAVIEIETPYPNIGQMIEFLGDDIKGHTFEGEAMTMDFVDTLWELVKFKLNYVNKTI